MNTKMTKREIIEETARFYSEDTGRRAFNDRDACLYQADDGRQCAVGRCLLPEEAEKLLGWEGAVHSLAMRLKENKGENGEYSLDPILEEKYRGHELDFWAELQAFHDDEFHWNEGDGLSHQGVIRLLHLLDYWGDE